MPRLMSSAHDFVEGIKGTVRRAKQELPAAQTRITQRANAHCRELGKFNPKDLVLLSTKKLRQPGPGVRYLNLCIWVLLRWTTKAQACEYA